MVSLTIPSTQQAFNKPSERRLGQQSHANKWNVGFRWRYAPYMFNYYGLGKLVGKRTWGDWLAFGAYPVSSMAVTWQHHALVFMAPMDNGK